jgi:hypothetical protein
VAKPTPASPLRRLLASIADDPEAGPWREWSRRLAEGDAAERRKAKAVRRVKATAGS